MDREGNEVQRAGGEANLLLYKGGTVCDDHFNSYAADAICGEMGFTNATGRFDSGNEYSFQSDYNISLDDVRCGSRDWSNCTFLETHNCGHYEDVFLACDVPTEPTQPGGSNTFVWWDATIHLSDRGS